MSTLFPLEKNLEITDDTRPLTQTGTIKVYIQLAEPTLFVQGFEPHEFEERPPTLLRGSLILRILKPAKIKSINLTFKGIARTEWPEGIPPKKQDMVEENTLVEHTWPFFNHTDSHTSGADIIRSLNLNDAHSSSDRLGLIDDISSINLDNASIRSSSNAFSVLKRVTSPSPNRGRSSSMKAAFTFGGDSNSIHSSANTEPFVFAPGDYIYNFEHPIPASTPETVDATFGSISYSLGVYIERIGAFKSNISSSLPIRIIRAPSDESIEDSEPIAISRDWEDQLHYDIVIASKAIILNAYLPIAFKLTPLDKIKLHRIRIYLTENVEYYCRNKKVHRMEPTKKYLVLELKAPPLKDVPPDADPKIKKMGNLLTSDGDDITSREFEFQVYIPQKLNNSQNLHPNTSYTNIKSHHWIKICLRLSRIIDGKPKHYEISIDSPIHVLDPLCAHANTLLPAYGLQSSSDYIANHESNIYFPMDIIPQSPPLMPLSPEVEPVNHSIHLNISNALNGRRSRASSIRSNTVAPNTTFTQSNKESVVSNIYKPDQNNLHLELTSPQAVPISPVVSPAMRPIHLIRRPSFEPPPFDADISPPPLMREPLRSTSATRGDSDHIIGISGVLGNAGDVGLGDGIDSMMQSPPEDPPTYEDMLKQDALSPINSPIVIGADGVRIANSVPEIQLTGTSPRLRESEMKEDDLGDAFSFSGGDSDMPASVLRATSPAGQRLRVSNREGRSGFSSGNTSRRGSFDSGYGRRSTEIPRRSGDSNNIDGVLSDDDGDKDVDDHGRRGRRSFFPVDEDDGDERLSRSRLSSRSSISPRGLRGNFRVGGNNDEADDYDDDAIRYMEPLLHTSTSNSYSQSMYFLDGQQQSNDFRGRFESKESLIRREPSSVDITALYSNNYGGFLRGLERNSVSERRNNSITTTPLPMAPPMSRRTSTAPIMSSLDNMDEEEDEDSVRSGRNSMREDDIVQDGGFQGSNETLTSTSGVVDNGTGNGLNENAITQKHIKNNSNDMREGTRSVV